MSLEYPLFFKPIYKQSYIKLVRAIAAWFYMDAFGGWWESFNCMMAGFRNEGVVPIERVEIMAWWVIGDPEV